MWSSNRVASSIFVSAVPRPAMAENTRAKTFRFGCSTNLHTLLHTTMFGLLSGLNLSNGPALSGLSSASHNQPGDRSVHQLLTVALGLIPLVLVVLPACLAVRSQRHPHRRHHYRSFMVVCRRRWRINTACFTFVHIHHRGCVAFTPLITHVCARYYCCREHRSNIYNKG